MGLVDVKDRKILSELDFNSRKTYSEIAKKVRMSKRGVEYKIQNLEKKQIILGYAPIINISKLGYLYCRIFVKFHNITKVKLKEIENYIITNKKIGWSIKYYGKYDNGFTIWAKNITEFKSIANDFYSRFSRYIKERTESVATNVFFYKNRYLLKNDCMDYLELIETEEKRNLDNLDKNILKVLSKNPQISQIEISRILNISVKTVSSRLKKLIKENILLGTRPTINHELLGYTYYKIFMNLVNFDTQIIKKFESYIASNHRTIYIIKAMGTCDLDIEIMVESNKELVNFIEDLQNKFPTLIKDYQTMLLTNTVKITYLPF